MRKTLVAMAAAIAFVAAVGLTVSKSEHTPPVTRAEIHMPSILNMMADERNLPSTPFVAP